MAQELRTELTLENPERAHIPHPYHRQFRER